MSIFDSPNRRIVDLTAPIEPHWRYPITIQSVKSFENGNYLNIKAFDMRTHWYTHIDAPLHYVDGGKCLQDFDLLNMLIGKCSVLNISADIVPNGAITQEMLERAVGNRKMNKMIFLRTDWGKQRNWESKQFWDDAPYMTKDAAVFIRELSPKVVGFDFPQDYDIRRASLMPEAEVDFTTHEEILKHGILMIEYMNGLWNLKKDEVDVVALPLPIPYADGAQIRVVAIEEVCEK